jgi:hypothetical protein
VTAWPSRSRTHPVAGRPPNSTCVTGIPMRTVRLGRLSAGRRCRRPRYGARRRGLTSCPNPAEASPRTPAMMTLNPAAGRPGRRHRLLPTADTTTSARRPQNWTAGPALYDRCRRTHCELGLGATPRTSAPTGLAPDGARCEPSATQRDRDAPRGAPTRFGTRQLLAHVMSHDIRKRANDPMHVGQTSPPSARRCCQTKRDSSQRNIARGAQR